MPSEAPLTATPEPEQDPASRVERLELGLRSLRDTARLGRVLGTALQAGDVLLLEGGLGVGKTTLVQFIARALGVPRSVPVTSPTFEIVHEFAGRAPIIHADLYRLDPSESLEELGLLARLDDAVVLVEWGARFARELGDTGLLLEIAFGAAGSARKCVLTARDPRGSRLLRRLIPLLCARGLTAL